MEKRGKRFLVIGLILVILCVFLAWMVQTDGGRITLKQVSLVSDNGKVIKAVMYIPKGVSKENKAPGVLAVHGGNSSRYAVGNISQEFAKRGYVVISLDQINNAQSDRGQEQFYGTETCMKYLTTLDFVDQEKLGVFGHSMGSSVVAMAEAYPEFHVKAGATLGAGCTAKPDTPINIAIIVGDKDENTGPRGADQAVTGPGKYQFSRALAQAVGDPDAAEIIPGKEYGSRENNTLRVFYQPHCSHTGFLYNKEAIATLLTFMGDILGVNYALPVTSQNWIIREFLTAIAFIGLFVVAFGVICMMLARKKEYALETPAGGHAESNVGYWISLAFMCAFPAVVMQPLYMAGKNFFLKVSSKIFAMEHISGVVFWMVVTALAILVVNLIIKKLTKNYDWAFDKSILKVSGKEFFTYLLIGIVCLAVVYFLVSGSVFFTDVCIRLYNTEVHPFTRTRFFVFFAYVLLFFLYYFIIGYVQTSGLLCKKQSVFSQYLRTALVSIIGPGVLLLIWYGTTAFTGDNPLFTWRFVLGVILNFLPGMCIGALIQVFCYRHTGKIWLGALINTLIFTWMSTSIGVMIPLA